MAGPVRVTQPLLDVLEVLLAALGEESGVHGWAIMKSIKRSGPTVYGVLDRLEDAQWVIGEWEELGSTSNRPRRRLYRLTPNGVSEARRLLSERRPAAAASSKIKPGWTLGSALRVVLGRAL